MRWSVDAFRLATAAVADATQIHTHMCYCEFNEIIGAIAELDADVISIESSRSKMDPAGSVPRFQLSERGGPGCGDIHSPLVPTTEEMAELLGKALAVLPRDRVWVNPDCGLKTRGWPEVKASTENMIAAARKMRTNFPKIELFLLTRYVNILRDPEFPVRRNEEGV